MGRLAGRIWVGATTTLICFLWLTPQLYIILPAYADEPYTTDLFYLLGPFNILLISTLYNYYLCVKTDPGSVPKEWAPDPREEDAVEVKRLTGGPRFCRTCRGPWVNNCVGHFNYGHFVRFLFFVDISCAYHLWMITTRAFGKLAFATEPTIFQIIMLIANYTLCVPTLLAVGMFSIFHFWSVGTNTTTIEGWEKDKVAVLKRKGKIREFKYPYNLGVIGNFSSVLGSNPLFWCLPKSMEGSGLKYHVAQDVGKSSTGWADEEPDTMPKGADWKEINPNTQYDWPPRDEFDQREREADRRDRATARSQLATKTPFTYGTGLNPDLLPSSSTALRQRHRGPKKANVSPYHDDFEPASNTSDEDNLVEAETEFVEEEEGDEEDEVPLGKIAARRALTHGRDVPRLDRLPPTDPPPAVRLRRGSEGLEIRPVIARLGESDQEWDRMDSESELDEDGDRRRVGERYRYYERERGSGESGESGSEDDEDSDGSGF
ncbi:hypothetical protein P7C70_g2090, partial [Phenoliferia sp. Uapishka_3]